MYIKCMCTLILLMQATVSHHPRQTILQAITLIYILQTVDDDIPFTASLS